jgi:lipopolysaccharide biosynthesis glycosyltransferase
MDSTQPIVVALSADRNFVKQLSVVIAGIARTATRPHRVFALHDGYSADLISEISKAGNERVQLTWLDARSSEFDRAKLPDYLPTATLFRLRIRDLLPRETDRVIYIDTDAIVQHPLDQLWEWDLGDYCVAAVRDPAIPWAAGPIGLPWSELEIAPDCPYFNAGVLVIDTQRWESEHVTQRALELLAHSPFRHGDQSALNAVLAGRWTALTPDWNVQAGHLLGDRSLAWLVDSREAVTKAVTDPAIVHFNSGFGFGRPWDPGCTHPYRQRWFDQLRLTPWRDWSPKRRPVQELARRARRACSIMIRG